ncbi:MAG: ABC transporter substrate-binding protein [Acidimicrobiia bacterium]|nr:ABC transporter substrate-binding protein [Acidimicrobiia bacterium]
MTKRPPVRVATVVVLALLTAGCTSSGPETAGGTATTAAADTAVVTTGPTTSAVGSPTSVANTNSFRGVTADTITVGIAVPDFDALQAAGIPNYQGDNETVFGAYIDDVNDAGGVHGRMIEPVFVDFDFTDPVSQDRACVELTEDHEVFIVLYGLLSESNLCFTDVHQTMVMTDQFQTTSLQDRSGDTLWLQLRAADDEQIRILGSVVAESGRLDDKTVGILANGSLNDGADGELLRAQLAELGHEASVIVTPAGLTDIGQQEAEFRIIAERFQADGVDFVFNLLGGGNAIDIFAGAGFTPELAYSVLTSAVDGAADPSLLDGAISVAPRPDEVFWEDPTFRAACVDPVVDAHPDLAEEFDRIPTGDEQAAGVTSWLNPTRIACNQVFLLAQIGEYAGADLTNDSFRAALDELGPVRLHGYGQATFASEGKWDGLDEFTIQEYDAAADLVRVVGDAIVIDR